MTSTAMKIVTSYRSASGPSLRNCAFLGLRYNEEWGYRPHEGESWILGNQPHGDVLQMFTYWGSPEWFTGLWRAPSGKVFVVDSDGQVRTNPDLGAPDSSRAWHSERIARGPLDGVWGLDEQHVYAWGEVFDGPPFLKRWDGTMWQDMAAPGFEIRAMHGLAPDLLYAVGLRGEVARFDGGAWRSFATPTAEGLNSVFVAGPDEVYATGNGGSLLEGSASGWGKIAESPAQGPGVGPLALHAVVKWRGELWVGGGVAGLLRRVGTTDRLEVVKPNIPATGLDARQDLLITTAHMICGTADGKVFHTGGAGGLLEARANHRLLQW